LWESEAERSKVLREKHERGRAARQKRKLRETDFASVNNRGTKHLKVSHRGQFQSKSITCIDTHKPVNKNATAHYQAAWFQNEELKSHDNGQQGLNQAFSQPPDHRHNLNYKPPFSRLQIPLC
ncbi:hypothetical protein R6Q57_001122, partial [Mikania cordata]